MPPHSETRAETRETPGPFWPCIALAWAAAIALAGSAPAREKTDLVYLNNGDRITGEIKLLDRGILQLGTNDIGTIKIEWEDVDSLISVYQFRVEDREGTKYFGALALGRSGGLRVQGAPEEILQPDVVGIVPLETSFWQQLDGSISLGFSYTKSNGFAQLTTDINVRRRTPNRLLELDVSSIGTAEENEETKRREDLTVSYNRLFDGPVFATASGSAQSNDELGLDLRVLFSGGFGLAFVKTNSQDLVSSLGLSVNREWAGTEADEDYHLEGFLSAEYSVFRHDYPKADITTEATLYPSLSFYDSYDNEPPDEGATKNDYGVVTSVGWTF